MACLISNRKSASRDLILPSLPLKPSVCHKFASFRYLNPWAYHGSVRVWKQFMPYQHSWPFQAAIYSFCKGCNLIYREPQVPMHHCSKSIYHGATVQKLKESGSCNRLPTNGHIVTQVDSNRYILTSPPHGISIHFNSRNEILPAPIPVYANKYGASEVALPCSCYIRLPGLDCYEG